MVDRMLHERLADTSNQDQGEAGDIGLLVMGHGREQVSLPSAKADRGKRRR